MKSLLKDNMIRYFDKKGLNIVERGNRFADWMEARKAAGLWNYQLTADRVGRQEMNVTNLAGDERLGLNFCTMDYLGLARDERVKEAAIEAIREQGVHSMSSGPLMGNNPISRGLEEKLSTYLGKEHVLLFPNGWSASFSSITGCIRKGDYVVMDELAHQSLQQGAYAATNNVVKFRHINNADLETKLRDIRAKDAKAGILVVTEGLYSMDSDSPDISALIRICKSYGALIMVDICHDFGVLGVSGRGLLDDQKIMDQVDIVVCSFSKVCGTNGGFMATNHAGIYAITASFGGAYTYATQLSPPQAAVASTALDIVNSEEGNQLRQAVIAKSRFFREEAQARNLVCGGVPSALIPVLIGAEDVARMAGKLSFEKGLICTVVEFPVVALRAARYRFSIHPKIEESVILKSLEIAEASINDAREILARECAA